MKCDWIVMWKRKLSKRTKRLLHFTFLAVIVQNFMMFLELFDQMFWQASWNSEQHCMHRDFFLLLQHEIVFCEIISTNKLQLNAHSHTMSHAQTAAKTSTTIERKTWELYVIRKRVKHNFPVLLPFAADVRSIGSSRLEASTAE